MKKVLIGIAVMILLTACGVKTHSPKEKQALITEVYGWSSSPIDIEAKAKLDKIMGDLEKEAAKGNKKAKKELQEWKEALPLKPLRESANVERWEI